MWARRANSTLTNEEIYDKYAYPGGRAIVVASVQVFPNKTAAYWFTKGEKAREAPSFNEAVRLVDQALKFREKIKDRE